MIKKRSNFLVLNMVSLEIVLLTISSFAIAFILSDVLVSADTPVPPASSSLTAQQLAAGSELAPGTTIYSGTVKAGSIDLIAKPGFHVTSKVTETGYTLTQGSTSYNIQAGEKFIAESNVLSSIPSTPSAGTKFNLGIYENDFTLFGASETGQLWNFFGAHLAEGLVWGGVIALGIKFLGPMLGLDEGTSDALSAAAFGGIVSGKVAYGLFAEGGPWFSEAFSVNGLGAGTIGLGVAALIFVLTYKKEKKKLVTFECLPFEPPLGGAKCEECNKDPFRPCSEYRCKSLGQACEILDPGSAEERCAWVNPKDVVSPTITPWIDVLRPRDLGYTPDSTIRPPNRGVKITKDGGACLDAFTPLEFGINIDEPAQCKIDYNHTQGFDDMLYYVGGSNYHRYNHTQKMKLPGPDDTVLAEGALRPELENDGSFSLYVRCRDANGNENVDEFVFNFCVDPSEDTTPPRVEGTSIESGGFVRFGADEVPIEVYVNEPAECKWSRSSKDYENMENSMSCATETYQINADLSYVCSGNLTGIRDLEDNEFFFRCKDQPGSDDNKRNVMTESYPLILKGSQDLNILNAGPNETIFGSTDTVSVDLTVRTDDGAEEGKAICYLSRTGEADSFIAMGETDNFEHRQSLDLVTGSYNYFFRCVDRGGNTAEEEIDFSVFVDRQKPRITRSYREDGLKVVTDEDAECVYSLQDCNYEFDEGLPMIYRSQGMKQQHFAEWKANSVYNIKCRDFYGNVDGPNECGIVVKSIEISDTG